MSGSNSISAEVPVALDEMTIGALAGELEKSPQQIKSGEGIPMNVVSDMLEEYDFSKGIKNPYIKRR